MSFRFLRVSGSRPLVRLGASSLGLASILLAASPSLAASWQNKVSYGGSTVMDLYVPDNVDEKPGVVVSLHYCSGNSGNAHGWFQSAADQYGFIIIAPSAGGNCFDATPARSGEREAITKMVDYVITQNKADETRVFAAGASSGACMTQALLAAYPDVFAGGSVLAGVPAGAWTGGNAYGWTTPAGRSAAQWGDIVRMAGPAGYAGPWPRIQLWHGTADTTLTYSQNFPAEVAQWSNVLGVSEANATKSSFMASQDTWERNSYRNASSTLVLETNVANNAPHDLSGRGLWADVVRFFGLDQDVTPGTGGTGGTGGSANGGSANGGSANGGSPTTAGSGSGGSPSSAGGQGGTGSGTPTAGSAGATTGLGGLSGVGTGGTAGQPSGAGGTPSNTSGGSASPPGNNSAPTEDGGCSYHAGGRGKLGVLALAVLGLGVLLRRQPSKR